jgi:hypothetical protein
METQVKSLILIILDKQQNNTSHSMDPFTCRINAI